MTMTAASLNGRAHTGGVNKDDIDLAASPRRRSFTADYKAEIFVEYDAHRKGSEARGSILRREGLYSSHISEWRKRAKVGAWEGLARESKKRCSVEEIELEKLRRRRRCCFVHPTRSQPFAAARRPRRPCQDLGQPSHLLRLQEHRTGRIARPLAGCQC